MKSIRRGQHLITLMLLLFLAGMAFLIWKLQSEASFYMSHASTTTLGCVYDRNGDVLFDPDATKETYASDHFIDVGNLIGDDSRQMTNTLVSQNMDLLANFSFMLGEHKDGKSSIHTTLDHAVNRRVYNAFGSKNGCAVAYNYVTGEIYVCLSKPSVNVLNNYADIDSLESGSLLCKVFYPTVPGSTQKISTTIAALETMGYDALMEHRYDCKGSYLNVSGQRINCHEENGHGNQNVMEAFSASCNPFYAQLVESKDLPLDDIIRTYKQMGYAVNGSEGTTLNVNGIACAGGSTTLKDADDFDTQWGCMGQGETVVSPLQMMVWQSAVATGTGRATMPYLIDHATKVNGDVTAKAGTKRSGQLFTETTAEAMRTIMNANGEKRYSSLLPGTVVGVKSGTAQVGADKHENSLLTGYVNDVSFPVAFCIVIEDRHEGEVSTSQIAATLLQSLKASLE
ncbi:MAG: ABC transporter permease [Oscillospiraceae bacterium]|nr:ABC transporter permease [Oscillospiraceae bacterium]